MTVTSNRLAVVLGVVVFFATACNADSIPNTATEVSAAECSDSIDNDVDGNVDCDDSECTQFVFCAHVETDGGIDDASTDYYCGTDNCDGCCFNNECITPIQTACGAFGFECQPCLADEVCGVYGCEPACTPDNCPNGCCHAGQCYVGETDHCGIGGDLCVTCASDATACDRGVCEGGTCDAGSCSGCCDGTTCMDGDTRNACGSDGFVCESCGSDICGDAQRCVVDPSSSWRLVLEDLQVPTTDESGLKWDPSFGPGYPDLYIEILVGSEDHVAATTTVVDDVVRVAYAGMVVPLVVGPAEDFARYLAFRVYDEDIDVDGLVGWCYENRLRLTDRWTESRITMNCAADEEAGYAGFVLNYHLQRF